VTDVYGSDTSKLGSCEDNKLAASNRTGNSESGDIQHLQQGGTGSNVLLKSKLLNKLLKDTRDYVFLHGLNVSVAQQDDNFIS
jgi:hypothetical protein